MTTPASDTTRDLNTFAALAARAALDASVVCRAVQQELASVAAITKDDRSPVTVADYASQAIVAWHLRNELGTDLVFVGEEDPAALRSDDHAPHRAAALKAVRQVWTDATEADMLDAIALGNDDPSNTHGFWTLDPVDGTKGFLRNQQYAVALAFVEGGTPVVGAMGCPNLPRSFDEPLDRPHDTGSLYVATTGSGVSEYAARSGALSEPPRRLDREQAAGDRPFTVTASVEKAHSSVSDTDRILEHLAGTGITIADAPARLDSQAKYAVVARGQADAYLRLPTRKGYVERIWDHAAGALIAAEAGCTVSDITGAPLDFSHGRGLETNRGIICAAAKPHSAVIEAIAGLGLAASE